MKPDYELLGEIDFSIESVPTLYQWSGYSKNSDDFKSNNFLCLNANNGDAIFVCSSENGVGLGEYIFDTVLKLDFIKEMEGVFSPGYDYWFLQAWEMSAPNIKDLDNWVLQIIEYLIHEGYILRVQKNKSEFFLFSNLNSLRDKCIPDNMVKKIKDICEKALYQFFLDRLDEYGDYGEFLNDGGGEWSLSILQMAVKDWRSKHDFNVEMKF